MIRIGTISELVSDYLFGDMYSGVCVRTSMSASISMCCVRACVYTDIAATLVTNSHKYLLRKDNILPI